SCEPPLNGSVPERASCAAFVKTLAVRERFGSGPIGLPRSPDRGYHTARPTNSIVGPVHGRRVAGSSGTCKDGTPAGRGPAYRELLLRPVARVGRKMRPNPRRPLPRRHPPARSGHARRPDAETQDDPRGAPAGRYRAGPAGRPARAARLAGAGRQISPAAQGG